MSNAKGALPPRPRQSGQQRDLASVYAPLIYVDANEPFLPLAVGYTIMAEAGESPSFLRSVDPRGAGHAPARLVIEYAIWWDWDIGHLYELEHTWSYIGEDGEGVFAEASWHGGYDAALAANGIVLVMARGTGRHPVVYCEPGKHALAADPRRLLTERREKTIASCGAGAGRGGLLVSKRFQGILDDRKSPEVDALAAAYLRRRAFVPAFEWTRELLVGRDLLVPWPALLEWVPQRIDWLIERLRSGEE